MLLRHLMCKRLGMHRKKYNHKYKSNSEYNCSCILRKNKVSFKYENLNLNYKWEESKRYIPDFILENGIILEVKGRFVLDDRKKHLFIRSQHPQYDIRFVFDNPNRKLYKNGKMTYADWCEKYDFKYCKLGDGIPEDWLETNGKRSEIYTRRRSTKG